MSSPALSKSRFMNGLQCHRLLWWSVHERNAPELAPDAQTEMVFAQGNLVGEEARRRFPGGVLVDLPHQAIEARVQRTAELIEQGAPVIFEASFRAEGVFVAVDVLVRRGKSWDLYEVKSSTRLKDEHLPDAAVQRHVLEAAGLKVGRVFLMHLNPECTAPELQDLFTAEEVTAEARALDNEVTDEARRQLGVLAGALPWVKPGEQCRVPRECPFWARCHEAPPAHPVSSLYYGGKRALELVEEGYATLRELPEGLKLSEVQARQVRAVKNDAVVVEPGLKDALDEIEGPIAFFDLETLGLAIPRWDGTRPWDPVPLQASVHVQRRGRMVHRSFLARPDDQDPRVALSEFLTEELSGAKTIFVWNASFEQRCLRRMGEALPALQKPMAKLSARLVDLLPLVRAHVYHPAFGGSFGLKSVAPALAPEVDYGALHIQGGADASAVLFRLWTKVLPAAEVEVQRQHLLEYCGLDTLAMVHIWRALQELAMAPKTSASRRRPRRRPP